MTRLSTAFSSPPALMPYFTLGYPDAETSLACIEACVEAGADLIELGVPFSDPLADGPTIQYSAQRALENGITLARCLEMTTELRRRGVGVPLVLMGYFNPILSYGVLRFVQDASEAGADGFIVPDLPMEEAGEMEAECAARGLALIYMLAPTSTPERIAAVTERARGFIYLVSVTGVTGARDSLPEGLSEFVGRVKRQAKVPIAVGFGISTPEQAAEVARLADGVIIGSAVISMAGSEEPVNKVKEFVRQIKKRLDFEFGLPPPESSS